MLLAGGLAAVAFAAVGLVTRLRGYRLGGAITVGLLAIYTLKSVASLLLFLPSAVVAYLGLAVIHDRTLLHGRDEFVAAILLGALPSLAVIGARFARPGLVPPELGETIFLGSLLPGLAAFNLYHVDPEYRRRDVALTAGLYGGLVLLGAAMAGPAVDLFGDVTPPVLLAPSADVAVLQGAVVDTVVPASVASRPLVLVVLGAAMLLSELVRRRTGLRLGVVTLGLVTVYTLANRWYLPLFLLETVAVFAVITAIHRWRFLYGRALLSLACGTGVALSALLAIQLPCGLPIVSPVYCGPGVVQETIRAIGFEMRPGLTGLMVGLVAGVMAYNVHVTSPVERRQLVPITVAALTVLLLLGRTIVAPGPAGFPQQLGLRELAGGALVVAGCIRIAARYHVGTTDEFAVVNASVLYGGES